ncbi:hypothetical protein [Niastella sp. OAS944]|uniref:hypothetical protein n=1 Tax=Niastella sp. OAS944 TaxID=2664089 RepID=UPI003498B382|nr:hypothetical protein [Chitinophagaceae bacterium OAS944]
MAQYVVHKIGFFYTDEALVVEKDKGTVMGITKSLEEAQTIKSREDLKSMKNVGGFNAVDFFFDKDNFKTIHKNIKEYFKTTYNVTFEKQNEYRLELPQTITDEQAVALLSLMELTFHNIVEYADDEVINTADYEFNEEEDEICGF